MMMTDARTRRDREISRAVQTFASRPIGRRCVSRFQRTLRAERRRVELHESRFLSFLYHVRNTRARLISSPPPRLGGGVYARHTLNRHTLNPYPDDPCDRMASFLVVTTRYRATAPSRYPSVHIVLSKNVHPRKKSDIFSDRFARPALLQP